MKKVTFKKEVEEWADKIFKSTPYNNFIDKDYEKMFLDYAIYGVAVYPNLLTEKETQLLIDEHNKNFINNHIEIIYTSSLEVLEKYKHLLTKDQLKQLNDTTKEKE